MKKVALVDIDGTLVQDFNIGDILDETFYRLGLVFTNSQKKFLYKRMWYAILNFLNQCKKEDSYGTTENFAKSCMRSCNDIFEKDLSFYEDLCTTMLEIERDLASTRSTLYNGVFEGLNRLKESGYHLYIYSNWFKSVQQTKLEKTNIISYFDGIYTIENNYAKPKREGYIKIMEELVVDPKVDHVIMIGNGTSDIPAKKLGISSIILRNGKELSKTVKERAPYIINSFDEIPYQKKLMK